MFPSSYAEFMAWSEMDRLGFVATCVFWIWLIRWVLGRMPATNWEIRRTVNQMYPEARDDFRTWLSGERHIGYSEYTNGSGRITRRGLGRAFVDFRHGYEQERRRQRAIRKQDAAFRK